MATISAKLNDEDGKKLKEICDVLQIDKSEAIRRATQQLWLALQIGRPFVERAGGRPQFLLDSGNPSASTRESRKSAIDSYLTKRRSNRGSPNKSAK